MGDVGGGGRGRKREGREEGGGEGQRDDHVISKLLTARRKEWMEEGGGRGEGERGGAERDERCGERGDVGCYPSSGLFFVLCRQHTPLCV